MPNVRDLMALSAQVTFSFQISFPASIVAKGVRAQHILPSCVRSVLYCCIPGKPDELPTFTILTGKPNELAAEIHDRMPVIVRPEHFNLWLDPDVRNPAWLTPALKPFSAQEMRAYAVSTRVNTPKNNDRQLVEAVSV